MYKKISHETFVNKVKEKYGDEYDVISQYEGSQFPITIKHNTCGEITTLSKALYLMSKYRKCPCKKCGIKQGHDKLSEKFSKKEDQFLSDIQNKFGGKIVMTGPYRGSRQLTVFKCIKHDCTFQNTPRNVYNSKTGCCPVCSQNKREDCYKWKGGNSGLKDVLRHYTLQWQIASRNFYKGKCLISDTFGKDLHHVFKSFNEIYYETLTNCGYDTVTHYNYKDFTLEEMEKLKEELLRLHNIYGYGVPMKASFHKEFHDLYGRGNNTVDQYIEFAASKGVQLIIIEKDNIKLLSRLQN